MTPDDPTASPDDTDAYHYDLPPELIAQQPLKHRADARLLVVNREKQSVSHAHVRDLPSLLTAGDRLVFNDTRVVPAALIGYRTTTGGRWRGLFLSADQRGLWQVLGHSRGHIMPGETITLVDRDSRDALQLRMLIKQSGGSWIAEPIPETGAFTALERVGRIPLPRYIRKGEMQPEDLKNYQTVFAKRPGAVAAPTAGLHFTHDLIERLADAGIASTFITLHVGLGTFRPISTAHLDQHQMHREWADVSLAAAAELSRCRSSGGRIVAIGSTAVRTLESAAQNGSMEPFQGQTDLFIRPPYTFRAIDAVLTNFHLPRTTLLVLVRTFGGDALVRRAYDEAIAQRYRFFSYGDAMLIL